MSFRVQIRRDNLINWTVNNPVLLSGEFGYVLDTKFMKIGDGTTPWNSLPYWSTNNGPTGPKGETGPIGATGSDSIIPGPTGPTGPKGETGPSGESSNNIYNSDGTLTGNRTLNGANNDLTFSDLNIFKTSVGGNDIGLKLDFANGEYSFGDLPNNTQLLLKNNGEFSVSYLGDRVIEANSSEKIVGIGDMAETTNGTSFYVFDNNQVIKTRNQGNDIGLKLDFANNVYELGQINGGNSTYLRIEDINKDVSIYNGNNYNGLSLNFVSKTYKFGEFSNTHIQIADVNQTISTLNQDDEIGLKLDFANRVYELGQITGNNATTLKIDDAAAFPVQVSGTNVTQTTSGYPSGKFLKIKVDGVDYVIELKNPSDTME